MEHALLLENLTKRYSEHTAVRDLSLAVPAGCIYGILGPNGAGKSTTLRMLMNIISRDQGVVRVLGVDPMTDRRVLRRVGYLPEERGLYKKMTVLDVIVFFSALKGVERSQAKRDAGRWLERMQLASWRDARVETLSKGMQQKVQFICTVLHRPELLVLDEPHSGLDPVNQEVLRETILDAQRDGRTVLLSTHHMEQAEQLCEYVCIIAGGEKVLDGRVRDVRRQHRGNRYVVEFESESERSRALMTDRRRVRSAERRGELWEVELVAPDGRDLLTDLAALDVSVSRFERVQPTLHEIFVSRVAGRSASIRGEEPIHA